MKSFNPAFSLILLSVVLFCNRIALGQGLKALSDEGNDVSLISSQVNGAVNEQTPFNITHADQTTIELNNYVWILKEKYGVLKSKDFHFHGDSVYNASFKPFLPDSLNCSSCFYSARVLIKNDSKSALRNWILYLGTASFFDVYLFNHSGILISHQKTGRLVPADQKNFQNGNRLERVALDFEENEQLTIYFKFKNVNGSLPKLNVKLSSLDYYKSQEFNRQKMLDGLFIGFLISIILFNLIFFFTTKDIAFFYQSVFVTSVLVFMIDIMDIICDIPFLRDHPKLFEPINFAAIILLNISYLQFVNKFIQLEKVFPVWVGRIQKFILINLIIGTLIIIYYFFTLNERNSDSAIAILSALQYAVLLILLFQLLKIKDKKSYFILMATFFLIAGVIVVGICVTFNIGVPITFSKFVVLGNVSFFFFGLAYRMKLLKEEEHEAIRLKENQELKNRLYANITHEFRTPLTVIQGMTQQIESMVNIPESSKLQKAIQLIKSNGNRLLSLVNTILDLAKLESGKMGLQLERGDLVAFLRYSVQLFESYAATKKIYLQFLTDIDFLEIDFDKEKLQQIVSNLISNAIKFTPSGGKINFRLTHIEKDKQPFFRIEVIDTGEGIPESELGNLFNRFFQVDSSTHRSQGSGLGLALVYELVQLMHGQIHVESQLGKGSTFIIELPIVKVSSPLLMREEGTNLEKEHGESEKYVLASEILLDRDETTDDLSGYRSKPESVLPENAKPLLLLVDDNKDILYYLQTLLEDEYSIETAYNGQDGISLALEIIPDIIISDVLMPEKDGYELCESLKSNELTNHIPIILLTAKSDSVARVTGLKKGADAYISKPFDENELKAQLENLLRIRKSLQKHFSVLASNKDSKEDKKVVEDPFLVKLNEIIHHNMEDEDFGILQLCRAMQMSRTQLHRKITALTGKSTSIYIRYLRLHQAKQLLKKPEMNISEVAFAVGFSDPNYFTRTFTEEFGITPSGYRSGV